MCKQWRSDLVMLCVCTVAAQQVHSLDRYHKAQEKSETPTKRVSCLRSCVLSMVLSVWAPIPLSQPSQDPLEQPVTGAWEAVVSLFALRVPHIAYAVLPEQRITSISVACLLPIMVPQIARLYSILRQCDTFRRVDTNLKPYLTEPLQKKETRLSIAQHEADKQQVWPSATLTAMFQLCYSLQ